MNKSVIGQSILDEEASFKSEKRISYIGSKNNKSVINSMGTSSISGTSKKADSGGKKKGGGGGKRSKDGDCHIF